MLKQEFIKEYNCTPPFSFLDDERKEVLCNDNCAVGYTKIGERMFSKVMMDLEEVRIDYKKLLESMTLSKGYIKINGYVFNSYLYVKSALKLIDKPRFGIIEYKKLGIVHPETEKKARSILVIYNAVCAILIADMEPIEGEMVVDVVEKKIFDVMSL
mgnify:CR=1 FL=1